MKRLFSSDAVSGFPGNILSEIDYNAIIDHLMGTTADTLTVGGDTLTFGEGNVVTVTTTDANGEFTGFTITARNVAERSPLYPDAGSNTVFRNHDMVSVDGTSSYTVLTPSGAVIPPASYTVSAAGAFTFSAPRTEAYLMVDGLVYTITKTITVTRDATTREIVGIGVA